MDTNLSSKIQELLDGTGKLVVFRGIGGVSSTSHTQLHQEAAVAIMKGVGDIKGLARLVQVTGSGMIITLYMST